MRLALVIVNSISAVMHIVFEIYMLQFNHGIYGFVLVENLIVTFFFIIIAYFAFISSKSPRLLYPNLIFWLIFEISVLFFKPTITTLIIFEKYLQEVEQWIVLAIFGSIAIIITCIEIIKKFIINYYA